MPAPLVELAHALSIFLPFPIDGDWSGGWGITVIFWLAVFSFATALVRAELRFSDVLDRLREFNDDQEVRRGGFATRRDLELVARDIGAEIPGLRDPVLALAENSFETDQGLFSTRSASDFIDPTLLRELVDIPAGPPPQAGRDGRLVGKDSIEDLLDQELSEEEAGPQDRRPAQWGDMVDLLNEPSEEAPAPPPPPKATKKPQVKKLPPIRWDVPDEPPRGRVTPALVAAGPSLLTAFGILGTFIGLVMGLDAGTSGEVTGGVPIDIETLVGGLHVSFRTSVIGLVCSLALTVLSRNLSGRAEREVGRLTRTLDSRLVRATSHEMLAHLYLRQEEATDSLKWLRRELSGEGLQATMEAAIRRQIRPLLKELNETTTSAADATARAVSEAATAATAAAAEVAAGAAAEAAAAAAVASTAARSSPRLVPEPRPALHFNRVDTDDYLAGGEVIDLGTDEPTDEVA